MTLHGRIGTGMMIFKDFADQGLIGFNFYRIRIGHGPNNFSVRSSPMHTHFLLNSV